MPRKEDSAALGIFSEEATTDLTDRLKRIEGQVRGVQRMVEEGRDCRAILNQLTAVRAAAYQVSVLLVRRIEIHRRPGAGFEPYAVLRRQSELQRRGAVYLHPVFVYQRAQRKVGSEEHRRYNRLQQK